MKHTTQIELFLHARHDLEGKVQYRAYQTDMSSTAGFGIVVTNKIVDVEFEIKDDFNLNVEMVNALRKEQKTIQAEAQMKMTQIEDRIQRLLCIEHKATA